MERSDRALRGHNWHELFLEIALLEGSWIVVSRDIRTLNKVINQF